MFHCIFLSLYCLEFIELLGYIDSCLSSHLGRFGPLFLQIFSAPYLFLLFGMPIICILVQLVMSYKFVRLCSFFFILFFFLFLWLGHFNCPVVKYLDPFRRIWTNLLLDFASEFLKFELLYFQIQNFYLVPFILSIPLFVVPTVHASFSWLPLVPCSWFP